MTPAVLGARGAALRADSKELDLLVAAHDASGSSAIADAMRFAHGRDDDRTRADVERAIDMMAHVDDLSLAKCARDYHERSDAEMQVCAACGVRDPFDLCAKTVALLDLLDTRWMCADGDALERLRALKVTHLFVTGLALDVCVAFSALHAAEEGFVVTVVTDACAGGAQRVHRPKPRHDAPAAAARCADVSCGAPSRIRLRSERSGNRREDGGLQKGGHQLLQVVRAARPLRQVRTHPRCRRPRA